MREINFRGKCNEIGEYNGQWIEGFYAVDDGKPLIAHSLNNGLNGYFCEPGSIGEYTGMQDKNNRKIFEGDILMSCGETLLVLFSDTRAGFVAVDKNNVIYPFLKQAVVIGNIHDNPELLEVTE